MVLPLLLAQALSSSAADAAETIATRLMFRLSRCFPGLLLFIVRTLPVFCFGLRGFQFRRVVGR